jgi:hypothetical protein
MDDSSKKKITITNKKEIGRNNVEKSSEKRNKNSKKRNRKVS